MGSISKELSKEAGIIPFLKLAVQVIKEGKKSGVNGTGQHRVKFVSDEKIMGKDYTTQKEREEVKFIFEEDGEQKQYRVPVKGANGELHYFIAKMSEFEAGDELILEYKKIQGSFKGYINISKIGGEEIFDEGNVSDDSEDAPQTPKNPDEDDIKLEDIPFN